MATKERGLPASKAIAPKKASPASKHTGSGGKASSPKSKATPRPKNDPAPAPGEAPENLKKKYAELEKRHSQDEEAFAHSLQDHISAKMEAERESDILRQHVAYLQAKYEKDTGKKIDLDVELWDEGTGETLSPLQKAQEEIQRLRRLVHEQKVALDEAKSTIEHLTNDKRRLMETQKAITGQIGRITLERNLTNESLAKAHEVLEQAATKGKKYQRQMSDRMQQVLSEQQQQQQQKGGQRLSDLFRGEGARHNQQQQQPFAIHHMSLYARPEDIPLLKTGPHQRFPPIMPLAPPPPPAPKAAMSGKCCYGPQTVPATPPPPPPPQQVVPPLSRSMAAAAVSPPHQLGQCCFGEPWSECRTARGRLGDNTHVGSRLLEPEAALTSR